MHGHLRVSRVSLDRLKEKEGLLVVYSLLGSEKVGKKIPCTMCCATNRADRPFFKKKEKRKKVRESSLKDGHRNNN